MVKSAVRVRLAGLLHSSGLLAWYGRRHWRNKAIVLMYHRILNAGDVPADYEPGMFVTTDAFERHLAYLKEQFEVVDLDTLVEAVRSGRAFSRTPCAITFDDGWEDNYTNAFPLLQRFGLPATVFLVTGQIGQPDMLTWEQVQKMEAHGVRFASHTVTHRELTILQPKALEWELMESRRQLEAHVARPSTSFCYPKGYVHAQARDIASKYYSAAVTTVRGGVGRDGDPFRIPRIGVHNDVASSTSLFALRLSGL